MRIITKSRVISYQNHKVNVFVYKPDIFGDLPVRIECNCCTSTSRISIRGSMATIFDIIPLIQGKKNELRTYLLNLRKTLKTT